MTSYVPPALLTTYSRTIVDLAIEMATDMFNQWEDKDQDKFLEEFYADYKLIDHLWEYLFDAIKMEGLRDCIRMQLLDNKASIYSCVMRYVHNEIAHRKKK
jgi:hypothetical protein